MNHDPVRKTKDDHFEEPPAPNRDYVGNIWGWKNSKIGAIIILAFIILVAVRYCQVKPDNFYIREEGMHQKNQIKNDNSIL